jgi:hypothetical protein
MIDANPYAAPLAYDPPKRPLVRPSYVASWFCWALRGGNRPALRKADTGELVLRQGRALRIFFWTITLAGPSIIGIVTLINPPYPSDWWAPWLISGGMIFGGVCGLLSNEQAYLSAVEIRKVGPFLFRRRMPWESVTAIDFDQSGTFMLRSSSGVRISLPADLRGLADLPDVLERSLPEAIRLDHADQLAIYRQFLGPPSESPQRL